MGEQQRGKDINIKMYFTFCVQFLELHFPLILERENVCVCPSFLQFDFSDLVKKRLYLLTFLGLGFQISFPFIVSNLYIKIMSSPIPPPRKIPPFPLGLFE